MIQPLHIDPALLAFFPPAKSGSGSGSLATLPSSSVASSSTPRIGVGYGGSNGSSNIGVGLGAGVGVGVGQMSNTHTSESVIPLSIVPEGLIDPALFELERVVKTIRSGNTLPRFIDDSDTSPNPSAKRLRKDKSRPLTESFSAGPIASAGESFAPGTLAEVDMVEEQQADPSIQEGMLEDGTGLGEEFDPTIREIVKSLTQAQENQPQSSSQMPLSTDNDTEDALSRALTDAQTVAAISAHLVDVGNDGMQQDMHTSLTEMTSEQLNSFFHQSPTSPNYLLGDYSDSQHHDPSPSLHLNQSDLNLALNPNLDPIPSSSTIPSTIPGENYDLDEHGNKRKRGRPKGSKNKPKSVTSPRPPKAPKARLKPDGPPKKIGRPPKERSGPELEEYLRRQAEAAAGIKRQRGRPRKFPGYLVRDMRLKVNREEFREVVKRSEAEGTRSRSRSQEVWGKQSGDMEQEGGEEEGDEEYDWANDPQNLMDMDQHEGEGMGLGMEGIERMREEEPSADTGLGRQGVGEMFGLETEVDPQS